MQIIVIIVISLADACEWKMQHPINMRITACIRGSILVTIVNDDGYYGGP